MLVPSVKKWFFSKSKIERILRFLLYGFLFYIFSLGYSIFSFSKKVSYDKSDVAIVLGAGTSDGNLSPVFKERINHAILLYDSGIVDVIIITGGYGKGEIISDSRAAKAYAIEQGGIPEKRILIEEKSINTYENILNTKPLMERNGYRTALLVSDPIHMKRSMALANNIGLYCKSSPTRTSRYKSFWPTVKFLAYEVFYFNVDILIGHI